MEIHRLLGACFVVTAVMLLQTALNSAASTFWKARRLDQNKTSLLAQECRVVEGGAWSLPCCVSECQQHGPPCSSLLFCVAPPLCCLPASPSSPLSILAVTSPLLHCHLVELLPPLADDVINQIMQETSYETTSPRVEQGAIFSLCGSSGECSVTNSECRNGTCQCVIGYHFYPGHGTCVDRCPNGYGATFYRVLGSCLNGNNEFVDISGMPEEQCMVWCASDPKCRSFEWGPTRCYLSYTTMLEHPADWKQCFQMDYYQRDCA